MSVSNKFTNVTAQTTGKAKEVAGAVSGKRELVYRGQAEQVLAHLKQAGEKLKDAFRI